MALTNDFSGRTVLVTGGASGIGLATVESFARGGATVALNHLSDDPRGPREIDRLVGLGLEVIAAPGSVSAPDEAEDMVATAINRLGRLDYLVNNAGISGTREPIDFADFDRMTESYWNAIISTNLVGPFRCTKAAALALRATGGAVCNTASVAGLGTPGSSLAYGASKAALINMTRSLARALAPQARVNAVAPGYVDTGWTSGWPSARREVSIERTPLKRACTPQDIADAIVFLCAGTTMTTGQTLIVDGGFSL